MGEIVRHLKTLRLLTIALSTLFLLAANISPTASALSISSSRDCDSNAVIRCGALSTDELRRKYNDNRNARVVFSHFGISSSDVRQLDAQGQQGYVTKSGEVVVDGKTVARSARTAGMQDMPGSRKVTRQGVTFYTRSPSVSFQQDRLPAFVMMKDGRFEFAVIASCGNPVTARPVERPTPPPAPVEKPVQESPQPPPAQPVQAQVQTQSQVVIVEQKEQVPPPPPQAPPTPAPAPKAELPDTGAGNVAGVGAAATIVGTVGHFLYGYIRRKYFFWV
jgi:hypothetical protein